MATLQQVRQELSDRLHQINARRKIATVRGYIRLCDDKEWCRIHSDMLERISKGYSVRRIMEPLIAYIERFTIAIPHICKTACERNCCRNCGLAIGSLHDRRIDARSEEALGKLKLTYGFSRETGFLGAEGCKLPRKLRSSTCRIYQCDVTDMASGISLLDASRRGTMYSILLDLLDVVRYL